MSSYEKLLYQNFRRGTPDVLIEGKVRGGKWTMFVNGVKVATIELGDEQSSARGARIFADAFTSGLEYEEEE